MNKKQARVNELAKIILEYGYNIEVNRTKNTLEDTYNIWLETANSGSEIAVCTGLDAVITALETIALTIREISLHSPIPFS